MITRPLFEKMDLNTMKYITLYKKIKKIKINHYIILKKVIVKLLFMEKKNELTLCPNCHKKIHFGTVEDIKEMLKIALEDDGIKEILSSKCIQDVIGGDEEIKKWILEMYNCSN